MQRHVVAVNALATNALLSAGQVTGRNERRIEAGFCGNLREKITKKSFAGNVSGPACRKLLMAFFLRFMFIPADRKRLRFIDQEKIP
ncbi:MAG: hypothetical protein JXA03_08630 [Bacteroidales bacterium]|nr:hypothetical protein [Bacteroidales bacterium]